MTWQGSKSSLFGGSGSKTNEGNSASDTVRWSLFRLDLFFDAELDSWFQDQARHKGLQTNGDHYLHLRVIDLQGSVPEAREYLGTRHGKWLQAR